MVDTASVDAWVEAYSDDIDPKSEGRIRYLSMIRGTVNDGSMVFLSGNINSSFNLFGAL